MKTGKTNLGLRYSSATVILTGLLIFAVGALSRHLVLSLNFPYPLEYGEGIVLNWILRFVDGMSLYPDVSESRLVWLHNPYGPLYFMLVSPFMWVSTNIFFIPRLFSFLGYLLVIFVAYRVSRRHFSPATSLLGVSLFAASPLVWRYATMARVDMFALALSVLSVWMMECAFPRKEELVCDNRIRGISPLRQILLFFSAGLFAAFAILIKPSFVSAAFAGVAVCITLGGRRIFIFFFGLLIPLLMTVLWVLVAKENGIVEHWTTMNATGFSPGNFFQVILSSIGRHPFATSVVVLFLASWNFKSPFWCFTFFNVILLCLVLKVGASANYFLPILACAAINAAELLVNFKKTWQTHIILYCLLVQLFIYIPVAGQAVFTASYGQEIMPGNMVLTPSENDLIAGRLLTDEIGAAQGDILCDDPGYLLVARKKIVLQPYQYGKLAACAKLNPSFLLEKIERGDFSLIILRAGSSMGMGLSDFPELVIHCVEKNYCLRREIGVWRVYSIAP